MINKFKAFVQRLWTNDNVRRIVHTFWQSFLAVFVLGITGIVSALLNTHNISDATTALLALIMAAAAAGLAALKSLYVLKSA